MADFDFIFEISKLNYTYNSHLGGVLGHYRLQMTSEVASDLRLELSDLKYTCSLASLACNCFSEIIHINWPIMIH